MEIQKVIPDRLIKILKTSRKVVVLTGAGVSADSGLPTFRDPLTGLWQQCDVMDIASPAGFRRNKSLVWGWFEWFRSRALKSLPNPAHTAIAGLEGHFQKLTVVTQNIDDLHERAGSGDVLHLHGHLSHACCFACRHPFEYPPGIPDEPEEGRCIVPPICRRCGGNIRPGVVWFGESVSKFDWKKAKALVLDCDVLLVVGTSSVVYPAAELAFIAARHGKVVVQVNPCATALSRTAQFNLLERAGLAMPAILAALER